MNVGEGHAGAPQGIGEIPVSRRSSRAFHEDEEMVRALGQDILQRHGYTILAAREAMEALQLAEKHQGPIHLLFTDMMMPGLSGPELAERLAFIRPETKVLHTSGYLDRERTQHHSKALSTAFLQKPFTPLTLTRKVHEVLNAIAQPHRTERAA